MELNKSGDQIIHILQDLFTVDSLYYHWLSLCIFNFCIIRYLFAFSIITEHLSIFESISQVNYFILILIIGEEKTYLNSDLPYRSNKNQKIEDKWFI